MTNRLYINFTNETNPTGNIDDSTCPALSKTVWRS